MTLEEFVTLLNKNHIDYFEKTVPKEDGTGKVDVYTGLDGAAFEAESSKAARYRVHRHSHEVYSRSGTLLYKRTYLGDARTYEDTISPYGKQLARRLQEKRVDAIVRTATRGLFAGSWRRARRWWGI